jgi:serine/threonine-protein kinase HipA
MHLSYEPAWLASGTPLSLSLALSTGELDAHDFFAGLLPEAAARQRACREHRIPEGDDFGLLLALGRDCAGSVVVLPAGESPIDDRSEPVPLTEEDLARLVASRGAATPTASDRQRFSLAGAQDKVAVRFADGQMWLADPIRPSSHILKFETHRHVCLSEVLAHDLGGRVPGLDIVDTQYVEHEEGPYLLIERYDRFVDVAGRLRRLHQEDVTQALGYPSSRKYEEDGGPSLADVAELIRQRTSDPIRDIGRLGDWQLFNYLIGNYDGHAKNLALLYPESGGVPRLAPFYDLVCLEFMYRVGVRYPRKLAFLVAGKAVPEEIRRDDWRSLANALKLPPRRFVDRLRELAAVLPGLARETRSAFAERFGDSQMLDRFEETIRDRCGWTLRSTA